MLRRWVGEASVALGTVWTWAGIARMIFGIRITLPIFPEVDLTRVEVTPALLIGLGLVIVGAWLKRGADLETGHLAATISQGSDNPALGAGSVGLDPMLGRDSSHKERTGLHT